MLYDIINFVVFMVFFSVGGMILFVLYKRYCSESKHYAFMSENSSKESRNQLYPSLHPVDGIETTAPELDLSERDEKDSVESKDTVDTEKISIPLSHHHDTKAVENDYVVPSDLVNVAVSRD